METKNSKTVPVDWDKFLKAFKRRGLTRKRAETELGISPNEIYGHNKGKTAIKKSTALLLEDRFGIHPEEYKPNAQENQNKEQDQFVKSKLLQLEQNQYKIMEMLSCIMEEFDIRQKDHTEFE